MPSRVDKILGSCSVLERGGRFAENLDASIIEDLRELIPVLIVREHVSNIIRQYFEKYLLVALAQILHGFIKHKKLKHATKCLGFQDARNRKARMNVTENISNALSMFRKSRKLDVQVSHRVTTIVIVAPSTSIWMFLKLKPWFIRHNIICDTCCFQYHIEF